MVASDNPLKGWQVDRTAIRTIGHDLQRPECLLAERNGTLWAADARGGVMRIMPDGSQQLVTPSIERPTDAAVSYENRYVQAQGSLPNGLAFAENGDFIIANWGTDAVEIMTRDGRMRTLYTEIDGQPLGKANFEARLDTKEEWLYVVESTAWRISRLRVQPNGSLTDRETYGPNQLDGFPDGFAFDAFGNLWVTLIFTDQLVAITPDGEVLTLLDDSNPTTKARLFEHFKASTLTPEILAATHGTISPWMASLTFGGPDLHTVYLGSLRGTTIPYFRSPVAGLPMIHWH